MRRLHACSMWRDLLRKRTPAVPVQKETTCMHDKASPGSAFENPYPETNTAPSVFPLPFPSAAHLRRSRDTVLSFGTACSDIRPVASR